MALPATDAFTGTNGTALATYSANWTVNNGAFAINTNAVYPNASVQECGAHWNADTFDNNQYAQGTIVARNSVNEAIGVGVRVAASAATYYLFYTTTGNSYLYKLVAGTATQLGSDAAALAVNDVIRLEANGTTITPLKNGSTTGTPGAQTDSSIASGYAGLTGYNVHTGCRLDGWEGGNLSVAAKSLPPQRRQRLWRRAL